MDKLELYMSELLVLKEVLEADVESSGWSEVDYSDVELMQYYLHRAKLLEKIKEVIKE
tara:strand:- start:506 stop:679 length:174 start_codon:yes stop_codon:yes gene_type:complete